MAKKIQNKRYLVNRAVYKAVKKYDQEQLEYLREWKAKHSGRAKEESSIKRICKKGRKLWTEKFLR